MFCVYHVDTMSHVHMFKCVTKSRYIELYLYTCTHVYMNMKTYVNVYTCCGTPQIYYMCPFWYSTHLYQSLLTSRKYFLHAISTFYCVICNVCVQMYKTPYPVSVCLMY